MGKKNRGKASHQANAASVAAEAESALAAQQEEDQQQPSHQEEESAAAAAEAAPVATGEDVHGEEEAEAQVEEEQEDQTPPQQQEEVDDGTSGKTIDGLEGSPTRSKENGDDADEDREKPASVFNPTTAFAAQVAETSSRAGSFAAPATAAAAASASATSGMASGGSDSFTAGQNQSAQQHSSISPPRAIENTSFTADNKSPNPVVGLDEKLQVGDGSGGGGDGAGDYVPPAPAHCSQPKPLGSLIGVARGTPAFSNGTTGFATTLREDAIAPNGTITGRQWDAAEYCRRWLLMAKDVTLPQVSKPADMWSSDIVSHLTHAHNRAALVGTERHANGCTREAPALGDLLVWDCCAAHPLGHAAVVQAVDEGRDVLVAEQGVACWAGANYSRKLKLERDEVSGSITVLSGDGGDHDGDDDAVILGWVRVQAPFLGPAAYETADRYRHIVGRGSLQRVPFEKDAKMPWLDRSVPWDNFQVQSFNHGSPNDEELPSGYYIADYDLWQRLRRLAESGHRLLCDTARSVILQQQVQQQQQGNEKAGTTTTTTTTVLEKEFGIPRALHGVLRDSLRIPCCTGRFDVGFDGSQLKIFEYNCDSSAALLETVETQNKIAEHYKFASHETQSAGAPMPAKLVAYWREFARSPLRPSSGTIHFMVDDDPEERYTALCMMQAAKAAKFNVKMQVKLEMLKARDGLVLDAENKPIECVWKTWSWDTAVREFIAKQQQQQQQQQAAAGGGGEAANKLRLCDVLFHPKIVVLEPFWKFVLGSKALLAYAYRADPSNEFLLKCFFHKDASIERAYVRKPVTGRTGANITIFDDRTHRHDSETLNADEAKSGGKWDDGEFVYQEKLSVVRMQKQYPILCAWVVGAQYGGAVVRESDHLITQLESPVAPLRISRF